MDPNLYQSNMNMLRQQVEKYKSELDNTIRDVMNKARIFFFEER